MTNFIASKGCHVKKVLFLFHHVDISIPDFLFCCKDLEKFNLPVTHRGKLFLGRPYPLSMPHFKPPGYLLKFTSQDLDLLGYQ